MKDELCFAAGFDFDFGSHSWFVSRVWIHVLIWSLELTFRPRCYAAIHRWNCSQFMSAKNFSYPRFSSCDPEMSTNFPDVLNIHICTHFGLRVRLVDVINCVKFYHNRLRGLDSKFYHSHWNAMSPLTLLELMFRCDI